MDTCNSQLLAVAKRQIKVLKLQQIPNLHGQRRKPGNCRTVDGQNPAPPRMKIIPLFTGFLTIPGGAGFLPSTVDLDKQTQQKY